MRRIDRGVNRIYNREKTGAYVRIQDLNQGARRIYNKVHLRFDMDVNYSKMLFNALAFISQSGNGIT